MIVLSVGMPRAGSGWYYNLTHDLIVANGGHDARHIRRRFHLEGILSEVNCNIGALTPRRLLAVLIPSLLGYRFVIKAHAAPTPLALLLIRRGQVRPTYIYRDPRDALLSVMENGRRALERGQTNAFAPYAEFSAALEFMQRQLAVWESWSRCSQALHVRYEDLLTEYENEAERLARFLDLDPATDTNRAVIKRYAPNSIGPQNKGLHFSHGRIGRFREKLTPEQQEVLLQVFNSSLERMGYIP